MKPLRELTLEDLARSPVWRCTGSPDSEASVERTELSALSEASPEIFVVRTSFTLSDGSSVAGYCSPADDSGLDYVQPVIITESGHAPLFYESPPLSPEPDSICRKLGRSSDQVFPIRYRAEIPVDGRFVEGEVSEILGA